MRSKYMLIGLVGIVVGVLLSSAVFVLAGNLDSTDVPANTLSYNLEDIYDRLDSGAAGAQTGFTEPVAGPGASGHTLDEVLGKAPAEDNTNGTTPAQVLTGKTYWSLRTDASGWGQKTGTAAEGNNVNGPDGSKTFNIPDGLYSGKTATANDAQLVAGNIAQGVNIFGVAGSALLATGDATAGDVLAGKTFSNASAAGVAGTMPNRGAVTYTPGTSDQAVAAGYHNGAGKVEGDADLVAGNVKSGENIFGVGGTLTPGGTAIAADLFNGETAHLAGDWALDTGTLDLACNDPTFNGTDNRVANAYDGGGNGTNRWCMTDTGDAAAGDILQGKKAWVDGSEVTGNVAAGSNVSGAAIPATCNFLLFV